MKKSLICSLTALMISTSAMAEVKTKEIRWFLAHSPSSTELKNIIQEYSDRLYKKSGKQLKVVVVDESSPYNHPGDDNPVGKVGSGSAEMSQVNISMLKRYNEATMAFDMPYMFRDHKHAYKVLDGEIGDKIIEGIFTGEANQKMQQKIRGLYFTYSGGYRVFYGGSEIKSLEGFKGKKMYRPGNIPGGKFAEKLGIEFVGDSGRPPKEFVAAFRDNKINLEEGELNRYELFSRKSPELKEKLAYVNETFHSLFLTLIVVNDDFLQTLDKKTKKIFLAETRRLAMDERKLSLDLEVENRAKLVKQGVHFIKLGAEDEKRMREIGMQVREEFPQLKEWIQKIEAVK